MAKLAKTTKTIKKIATPKVEVEEVDWVEEREESKTNVVEWLTDTPTVEAPTHTTPISLNEAFMAQVDRALENAYKLYERKCLTRQEIQSIANSVLR